MRKVGTLRTLRTLEKKSHHDNAGFTMIELMTVVAIIGILAIIAIPQYQTFAQRAEFTELVTAANPLKTELELAIQTRGPASLETLDAGGLGLPAAVTATAALHGASIADGVITMTWMDDGSGLAGLTYILSPSGIVPPISWSLSGSCIARNLC